MFSSKANKRKKRRWMRLENASKIFLAARTARDTKVFRLTAEFTEAVQPDLLQAALEQCYARQPLFHSVIRRGMFWYYLEESNLEPRVEPETASPCAALYHYDTKNLLFRLLYHQNRVHLEVFHSLCDGTGALWFFEDIISAYLLLLYPEELALDLPPERKTRLREQQLEDSFSRFFGHSRSKQRPDLDSSLEPVPAARTTAKQRIFRLKGQPTADRRLNIVELQLVLPETLAKCKALGVSLSVYLTAVMLQSLYDTCPEHQKSESFRISVPINLRGLYPSESSRNFFAAMTLQVEPSQAPDFAALCEQLAAELDRESSRPALQKRLEKLMRYEENIWLRIVPRPLKDVILACISKVKGRAISFYISNLGRVRLGGSLDAKLRRFSLAVAATRPQFCSISQGESLTITLLSPFMERNWQERFQSILEEKGLTCQRECNHLPSEESSAKANPRPQAALSSSPAQDSSAAVQVSVPAQVQGQARAQTQTQATLAAPVYPEVPLSSYPHLALKILAFISLSSIALAFLAEFIWPSSVKWAQLLFFALSNVWLVGVVLVRKRRNIAKNLVYQLSILSLISLLWDLWLGWQGWSINYAIPIILASALVVMFISVHFVRLEVGDYVLYLMLAALLGLVPLTLLLSGVLYSVIPSFIAVILSVFLLLAVLIFRGGTVRDELLKRWHL